MHGTNQILVFDTCVGRGALHGKLRNIDITVALMVESAAPVCRSKKVRATVAM